MPAPLAHTHYKELDLEVGRRLPLTKHFKDSLLSILVFHRRTLRAFEPADHVLHRHPFMALKSSERLLLGRLTNAYVGVPPLWRGGAYQKGENHPDFSVQAGFKPRFPSTA